MAQCRQIAKSLELQRDRFRRHRCPRQIPKVTAKSAWTNVEAIEVESIHERAEEIKGTVRVSRVSSEGFRHARATVPQEVALSSPRSKVSSPI